MRNKIALELSIKQIERLVEKLPIKDKIRLVKKLEEKTAKQRWNQLLKKIDEGIKKYPITEEEIAQEIREVRKVKYD